MRLPLILTLIAFALTACAEREPEPDPVQTADVVIIGEVHGVADHHAYQAALVASLQPAAIVFEQVDGADTARLNGLLQAGASDRDIAQRLGWAQSGWPDFGLYAQIMRAAPSALILGADAPDADVRQARLQGAASAFGAEAARYGLTVPLAPAERATREQAQFDAHCGAVPLRAMSGFVEAQRYRDAVLAQTVLLARERTRGGTVVLITGNGHARIDWGAPRALLTANPDLAVWSIGQVGPDSTEPFNEVRVQPLPAGEDPCAAFGITR